MADFCTRAAVVVRGLREVERPHANRFAARPATAGPSVLPGVSFAPVSIAMNAPLAQPLVFHAQREGGDLAARLRKAVAGEILFDAASRGRYATDASIYQVEPLGVLVPRTHDDVRVALDVCRDMRVPVLPRGA